MCTNETPLVTIIMPIHNVEKYLKEAINSILKQTYTNFEFLIIDDASTDNSYSIAKSYKDSRLKIIKNSSNKGIAASINIGIDNAHGEYLIRQDGDDVSHPDRIEKQIHFMLQNPLIGICGSCAHQIDSSSNFKKYLNKKASHEEIEIEHFFGHTGLIHSSIIINNNIRKRLNLYYDESLKYAEDYDLYCRWSQYSKLHNIQEYLVDYRVHPESVCAYDAEQVCRCAREVLYHHLKRLRIPFSSQEFSLHCEFALPLDNDIKYTSQNKNNWLSKIIEWNEVNSQLNNIYLKEFILRIQEKL